MSNSFLICFCNIILFDVLLGFSGAIVSSGFVYHISYVLYNCSSLLGIICIRILLFIGVLEIMGRIPISPSITSLLLNFYVIFICFYVVLCGLQNKYMCVYIYMSLDIDLHTHTYIYIYISIYIYLL